MSKYLYMVNPRIPLKLNGEVIRRSKNLELDIEDVKFALKHGPVYRKFDAQCMERVTLQNIDKLHVVSLNETKEVAPVVKDFFVQTIDNILDNVTITGEETIVPGQDIIPDEIEDSEQPNPVLEVTENDETNISMEVPMDNIEETVVTEEVPENIEGNEEVIVVAEESMVEEVTVEESVVEQQPVVEQQSFRPEKNNQYQRNNYNRKKRKNR